jgi:hypothetical protein
MGLYISHNVMTHRIITAEPAGQITKGGIDEKNIRIRDGVDSRVLDHSNRSGSVPGQTGALHCALPGRWRY